MRIVSPTANPEALSSTMEWLPAGTYVCEMCATAPTTLTSSFPKIVMATWGSPISLSVVPPESGPLPRKTTPEAVILRALLQAKCYRDIGEGYSSAHVSSVGKINYLVTLRQPAVNQMT